MSEKIKISIEKDVVRYGYKIGLEFNLNGLELEKTPGLFGQMLNKKFQQIIFEIQKMASDHDKFIDDKYFRVYIPEYYECPKCGQWINENDRKEHEKRWFDYSVCPQPGGIIHIRREDEGSQKQNTALPESTEEMGEGLTDPKDG